MENNKDYFQHQHTLYIHTLFSSDGNIRVSLSVTHSSCHTFLPDIWFFFHLGLLVTWFSCHLWVFLSFECSCGLGFLVIWVFLSLGPSCHLNLFVAGVFLSFGSYYAGLLFFYVFFCLGFLSVRLSVTYSSHHFDLLAIHFSKKNPVI